MALDVRRHAARCELDASLSSSENCSRCDEFVISAVQSAYRVALLMCEEPDLALHGEKRPDCWDREAIPLKGP